ncbi:MAG: protein kinase domain-containing protein [Planctomycetota bacterium]
MTTPDGPESKPKKTPTSDVVDAEIGPFRVLATIGEGGFGTVHLAEQLEPVRRQVALKVLKAGMDTRQVVARFEQERQALALMDHPGIAKIYAAGATASGRPYVAMELIRGLSITSHADSHRLGIRARLELFMRVCDAVQHAHQKGIIHRDLKPSNVLVTLQDSVPTPKIIDFGIAKALTGKLTGLTLYTEHAQLMGTPEYMSPEQAEFSGLDVDTRSDIYSLGVVLYELLAGAVPFEAQELRAAGFAGVSKMLRERDPARPSAKLSALGARRVEIAAARASDPASLGRALKGELDWVVMRCLEKDRTRRYETASALARDIGRYLRHEPVEARPPSTIYRLKKLTRRHRVLFGALAALFGLLCAGVGSSTGAYFNALRERENARRISVFYEQIFGGATAFDVDARIARPITDSKVEDLLSSAARRIGTSFADWPALEVQVRRTIGLALFGLGATDEGITELRRSAELARDSLPLGDLNRLMSLRMLGARLFDRLDGGDVEESATLLAEALEEARPYYAVDTPVFLDLQMILSWTLTVVGEPQRALELGLSSESSGQAVLLKDPHLHTALLASIGANYRVLRQFEKSLDYTSRAAKIARALDPQDPNAPQALEEHGNTLTELGRFAEALEVQRETFAGYRRVYGEAHQYVARHQALLALAHLRAGQLAAAEDFARGQMNNYRKLLGEDSLHYQLAALALVDALRFGDKSAEALPHAERCAETISRLRGANVYDQAHAVGALCDVLVRLDRWQEAEQLLRGGVSGLSGIRVSDFRAVFPALSCVIGVVYAETAKFDEAELLLETGLAWCGETYGPRHERTLTLAGVLAKVYEARGRAADAERLREKAR